MITSQVNQPAVKISDKRKACKPSPQEKYTSVLSPFTCMTAEMIPVTTDHMTLRIIETLDFHLHSAVSQSQAVDLL